MSRNRLFNARTLVLGGLAVAAVAGALKNRHKVAGLIGARSSEPEPYTYVPPAQHDEPPQPISNYDAPGPPANTATPIPAPDPVVHENHPIDEEAEEAAAAEEAANIGGPAPEYGASTVGERVDEADRPLEESGEGVAEGFEQAEYDLEDDAEPKPGEPLEGERQVEEAIEEVGNPYEGEVIEVHDHIHPSEVEKAKETKREATAPEDAQDPAPLVPETFEDGAPTAGGTQSGTTGAGSALGETEAEPDADASGEEATSAGSALGETPAAEKSSAVWKSSGSAGTDEQPTVEQAAVDTDPKAGADGDDGSEWQTWSGRAVDG